MSNESKLLTVVANNPDDDAPRLVLADWYEETGNLRGHLIRAQCEMGQLDWDDPQYVELEDEVEALITQNQAKWIKELPKLNGITWGNYESVFNESVWDNGRSYFRRGFVESVSVKDRKSLQANLAKIKKSGIVSFISLVDTNTAASYELLKKIPSLKGICFASQIPMELEWLEGLKQLSQIESIGLSDQDIGGEGTDDLLQLEMPSLRALDVSSNNLETPTGMRKFLKWNGLERLRWLDVSFNRLGGPHGEPTTKIVEVLSKSKKLANLFSLRLSGNDLDDSHLDILAKHAKMKRLVHLDLSHTTSYYGELSAKGIASLFAGKFRHLRFLNLSSTEINNAAVKEICDSKWASSLKRLNIGDNEKISDVAISAIAKSPNLENLTHLNIPRTKLGEKGAKALIASKTLNSIRQLNIGKPNLSSATIKALQKQFPKAVIQKPYY